MRILVTGANGFLGSQSADDYLMQLPIDWVVLRPSFIYGAGSYGGSSLFRGMAALPWIIPVFNNGQQRVQPIHIEDLATAVINLLDRAEPIWFWLGWPAFIAVLIIFYLMTFKI
jgi:nucleoside-diphosphate-sugar epimerase